MSCSQPYIYRHQPPCSSISSYSSKPNSSWIAPLPFPCHTVPAAIQTQCTTFSSTTAHVQLSTSTSAVEQPPFSPSKSKSSVWVNPRSRIPSKLREKSHDARYAALVQIARTLDSCGLDQIPAVLADFAEQLSLWEQDAVSIINNISNPDAALLALRFFRGRLKKEVIVYNVTFKVLRSCRDFARAENLFDEMLERGVPPNNVTFSTIITCAMVCNLPLKAVEWFEKMPSFGLRPDDVTLSAMIDAYGRAGNPSMALGLYDRARSENWRLDPIVFSTLIKMHSHSQNYDGCLNVFEEMKAIGVKPNLIIFNTLLEAMGRAKRPWQAKAIYKEMVTFGLSPNRATYSALLRAYCKGRYHVDGLEVYREMKEKGISMQVTLYNALLAMFADLGFLDEAIEVYEDMKRSEVNPDTWTFSSLVTVFSCSGKVSEAELVLDDMLNAGLEPTLFILTSLIQCYGKVQLINDVVQTCNRLSKLGITPDDHFYGCLLNVMTQSPSEELVKIIGCVEDSNPKLGSVLRLLVDDQANEAALMEEAATILGAISSHAKKAYCNCLIDICVNLNMPERASCFLDLGQELSIYTNLQLKSATQWSLHLKGLSLGAARTALRAWMRDLSNALEAREELPAMLGINTGHGKHKFSVKSLAGMFESHLKEMGAPFHETPDREGWFLTTRMAAETWLGYGQLHKVISS